MRSREIPSRARFIVPFALSFCFGFAADTAPRLKPPHRNVAYHRLRRDTRFFRRDDAPTIAGGGEVMSRGRRASQGAAAPDADSRGFLVGLARAFGGAIIFALPIFMTQEMWQLGFYIEPSRLALLLLLNIPLLVALSHFVGFENTVGWVDDLVDAFVAYAVGFAAAVPVLVVFGVLTSETPLAEMLAMAAIQAVPGSIGALLAQSQFGGGARVARRKQARADTYAGETFFMAAGALFLSFNIAPTEEIVLISFKMTPWHGLALACASIALMHAFVYSVDFSGQSSIPASEPEWSVLLRYTLVGYAICLAISAYMLWTFGRAEGTSADMLAMAVVVLSFPAAVGAAAARLIL